MECATPLGTQCANCGTANGPGAKFCMECAAPLAAGARPETTMGSSAIPGPASSPAGARAGRATSGDAAVAERRLVSILFADLVGFTPFAADRDAEDVRETLTRYFDLARDVIGRDGGTVEKFIGDAAMAVWGAPIARVRGYRALGLAFDAALMAIDLVIVLAPADRAAPDLAIAVDAPHDTLARLGARPFLERLNVAGAPRPADGAPGGARSADERGATSAPASSGATSAHR
jgi:class 3 adenylate cyclase